MHNAACLLGTLGPFDRGGGCGCLTASDCCLSCGWATAVSRGLGQGPISQDLESRQGSRVVQAISGLRLRELVARAALWMETEALI